MKLFLIARTDSGLHSIRVFPEAAAQTADHEAEVLRGLGYKAEVFVGADLLDVARTSPAWFAESPTPQESVAKGSGSAGGGK